MSDLTPIAALPHLEAVILPGGSYDLKGLQGMRLKSLDLVCLGEHRITDLSPLRGMPMEYLRVWMWNGDDLSPLRGMPLRELNVGGGGGKVGDLSVLRGMPLQRLFLQWTDVADLSALRGVRLEMLMVNDTAVTDLSPLRGMPLTLLEVQNTGVSDLSPVQECPLRTLKCDFEPGRAGAVLRGIKTLETINGQPAAEFWKKAGKE